MSIEYVQLLASANHTVGGLVQVLDELKAKNPSRRTSLAYTHAELAQMYLEKEIDAILEENDRLAATE